MSNKSDINEVNLEYVYWYFTDVFTKRKSMSDGLVVNCPHVGCVVYNYDDAGLEQCKSYTIQNGGNVFNFRGQCCAKVCSPPELLTFMSGAVHQWDV